MPKSAASGSSRPALRRNQACRSCRKRKLKCDAARPHCGTCVKQWQALVSVPAPVGYAHPSEPQCSYDPVEGLVLAPDTDPVEKIRHLEDEISQLKNRLYDQQMRLSPPSGRHLGVTHTRNLSASPGTDRPSPLIVDSPDASGIALPQVSLDVMNMTLISESPDTRYRSESSSPQIPGLNSKGSDPFMDLLFSGWNPDLPDPVILHHYIDVFFRCDPCGSRVLHRPGFLASLQLSPRDPGFPHSAILHAICASASRWSPQGVMTQSDGTRRDQFAEYHVSKTRQYIDRTMVNGQDIFPVMQACSLLAWYFYQEGRWVEVWIFAGFQTRVAVPLRLNYPGTFSTHGNTSPGAYLAPPKNFHDLESRRRTWWMAILFDRIASVGGWIHAVDERDIGTEFPLRNDDFESELAIPSNPQDLTSQDVFTTHPPLYTDSFLLLIKAVMLFGKVTDFNVRGNLRAPTAPSKNQNPFFLPGFEELDNLVCLEFLERLPPIYKATDSSGSTVFDTDLYMVHVVPHAATITLHNPYVDFSDPQCVSTARCVDSARAILAAYYRLSSTSFDISRLHPFITICWYLAAVVQVQLCKYFIEIGDSERESAVWGEINVLRFAMLEYGSRSPIGTRQEKLLQGLMQEIVRMTAQQQPLEVGVPLYHFSHATLFRKGEPTTSSPGGVPLPTTPSFDEQTISPPPPPSSVLPTYAELPSHGPTSSGGTWPLHEMSASPMRGI